MPFKSIEDRRTYAREYHKKNYDKYKAKVNWQRRVRRIKSGSVVKKTTFPTSLVIETLAETEARYIELNIGRREEVLNYYWKKRFSSC